MLLPYYIHNGFYNSIYMGDKKERKLPACTCIPWKQLNKRKRIKPIIDTSKEILFFLDPSNNKEKK